MASCYIAARTGKTGKSYHVKYRRGGESYPIEHAGAFPTKRAAELRRSLVLEWLAAGKDPAVEIDRLSRPPDTVAQLADRWLAGRVDIDTSTRGTYAAHARRVTDTFGRRAPQTITPGDCVAFLDDLEGLKPGTVRQVLAVLRMILDHADLPANPARHQTVKTPRDQRRVLEPPDAATVLSCFQHCRLAHRPALVLLEQTGMRVSEALQLQPGDVDRRQSRVRVRPETSKTDRPRWVPCPRWLIDEIRLPFGGTRQAVRNAVAAGCVDAGVRHFRVHDLRHRRASLWHQQGVPAVELAARLGHSRPSITLDTYSHVMPLEEIQAHDLLLLLSSSARSARST